ncbi:MAG TPA: hypothetical protein GXX51_06280 [Firmicutes bacterium]|nr:hypothetical protein [Bacillota bacterium]
MPMVMALAKSIKDYLDAYSTKRPDIKVNCSNCEAVMKAWSRYFRHALVNDTSLSIPIYRWRCPKCKRTCGVLPDFLAPHLTHTTNVREGCVRSYSDGSTLEKACEQAGVDVRTASRWIKRIRTLLDDAISLTLKLVAGG